MKKNVRLIQLREQHELTQKALGDIIERNKQTVYAYETGRKSPGDLIKKTLADFFGVTVDYLFFEQLPERMEGQNNGDKSFNK
ncbi:hypothetical protein BK128_21405 [Viridibacillus sp. FSL H7-0596]|uniref:helix-turn-helix transcriptional regulator n=1 Tax=Viridibacillus sp. FSL H7-0596 TaxID=1928923 RepID=UPI00096C56E5|nr:helix-turn-helix domain-containing protein [Viridibacillus sp. FSL H7-0596]OMC81830.1 hypothetical protein BK128_21405 [Viridibacillus sp. FSL H7-0596]